MLGELSNKTSELLDSFLDYLPKLSGALLLFIAFVLVAKVIRLITERLVKRINRKPSVVRLIATIIYIIVILVGLIGALKVLALDGVVTSVLAGAGIVGLALGFAFQDIASNFIAGVTITMQPQFNVGNLVEVNEVFGVVQRIDLRTTTIKTLDGQIVYIPNKDIFLSQVIDYTRNQNRRIDLKVGVSYGEDLNKVKKVTLEAIKKVEGMDYTVPAELYFEEFGDSSINLSLLFWIKFESQPDYLEARSQAIMAIKEVYDREDILIPFPITTLDFNAKGGRSLAKKFVD